MHRTTAIQELTNTTQWDIIIVGGGATGLGAAVDAATRGYKTLLLEKSDFAKGTSSRATKLVHGGVRYLAQGNIRLVREALIERGRLLNNAPHLTNTISFVLPFYNLWQKVYYGFGLWLYELLSGKQSLGPTKLLDKKSALAYLPGLDPSKLVGGILYADGQFDDSRLAINLAQTAASSGATVINYMAVSGFEKSGGKICAVLANDQFTGHEYRLPCKVCINATGVFADELLQLAEGHREQTITPSQGIHLVLEKDFFEGTAGLMIPKTDDGRVLFAIPWYGKLLVGTTDTPVQLITDEPRPLSHEVKYVLDHFNRYTKSVATAQNILSVFAGLRPLAKTTKTGNTAVMPRDHQVLVLPSGLVHVTGGKWTTYRSMAEHAVNKAIEAGGLKWKSCITKNLQLHGYSLVKWHSHWAIYGSDALLIKGMLSNKPALSEEIHPKYPYTLAEVQWMIDEEMAMTVEDILARRIRLLFLDARAAIEAAPLVAELLAKALGKDAAWQQEQIGRFVSLANGYLPEV